MKLKILTGVAALVVVTVALAIGAMATASADTPNCITKSLNDDTCVWELELTKVEVAVEYEYPHCEVKLTVEHNMDDLPEGARVQHQSNVRVIYRPPGADTNHSFDFASPNVSGFSHRARNGWRTIGLYNSGEYIWSQWSDNIRYKHDELDILQRIAQSSARWQQVTLGSVYMQAHLDYGDEFRVQQRVGNAFTSHVSKLPNWFLSDSIPLSHTFSGLTEEIFTCGEVAKREAARVEERSALDTEKAGLRQSLKLLEAELARAREHELDATNVLKEVIAVSERVEEARRTIQRLRVEGIAERRKLIERYYAEESQRYSVFIKSLEASAAALAASDKAIAAHKAELEASRARLDALVTAAQEAEAELIAEIERAQEALGEDDD